MSALTPVILLLSLFIPPAHASSGPVLLTSSAIGLCCVGLFVLGYALVLAEEYLQMRNWVPDMNERK